MQSLQFYLLCEFRSVDKVAKSVAPPAVRAFKSKLKLILFW